ncbi:MAG: hypothetical protein IKU03_05305 [Bacteroidales bacterium]|nr:hypothetical protein [Bacteroidales bacterium]
MKKIVFACLLAFLTASLFGQNVNVLKENIVKAQLAPWLAAGQLESADNHLYLYYTDNTVWAAGKPVNDVVYVVDKDNFSVSEIHLQHLNSYNFVTMYEDEANLYVLYSEWQNKTKTYTVCMNTIDKNATTARWNPDELLSVTTEKRDGIYLFYSVSPDKSKLGFGLLVASKKSDFKGSVAMAYGEGGEKLWEDELDLDFSNKTFSVLDFVMDNNAVAYAAISSYTNVTKTSRSNEALQFLTITGDNSQSYSEDIEFGYISSSKLKMAKNGNVVLGGYYNENLNKNEAGAYMAVFDPQRGDFTIDNMKFPSDYYAGKAMFGIPAPSNYATNVQYIEEFADGTLLLLGEMRAMVAYTDNRGMTTYRFFARNIPVVYADATGKINDFALIKKNQMASAGTPQSTQWLRGQGFSYKPLMHNNKLYLFFNDAVENYTGKIDQISKPSYAPAHASAYCVIEPGKEIETKAIMNGKVTKYRLVYPLIMDDDYVLGVCTNKKKMGDISKINFSF